MTRSAATTGRDSFEHSLWHATAGELTAADAFEPGRSYDCIVIGAGIAGVVSALTLQSRGARVAILEAAVPGSGATGRAGGFVVPTFSAIRPAEVIRRYGDRGERLVCAVAGSADVLFDLVRKHGIECDGGQQGWFHPAHSPEALERIAADAKVWRSYGATMEVLDARATRARTGVQGYAGSLFVPSGGAIHPVKLLHGLISAARALGLHLFSGVRALSAERSRDGWTIETPRGPIHGHKLLVCTNARSPVLFADLEASIVPLRVCQIATRPLAAAQRARLLQQGQSLSDTQLDLFSYRFDAQWRLISGAMPVLPARTGQRLGRRIVARIARELGLDFEPQLEYVWFGEASVTADRLPALYEVGPGAHAITACNGRGLATSAMLGIALGNAVADDRMVDMPLPVSEPEPARRRRLQMIGSRLYPVYGRVRDALRI
ncbi:MAG TPA: FAD-dependent oxidoreductase [Steroidobacteraceae bacterium]|nr:FAD-dependent oxidoreductase [Steroidobacteraceae bacterium]